MERNPTFALMLGVAALAWPGSASAQLPEAVRAMIDAAIAEKDQETVRTVIDLARATNPDSGDELDEILTSYEANLAIAEVEEQFASNAADAGDRIDTWSGQGELGAFRATGNTSNVGVTGQFVLERRSEDWRHIVRGRADYQSTDGVTTREQFLLGYEPNLKLNDNMFLFALAQYERDRFQGFAARYAISTGVGYRIAEADDIDLSIKAGPGVRRSEFVDGRSITRLIGNAALDLEWRFAENLALTQNANAFVQSGGSSFVSETGLRAEFNEELSARLSYAIEHDTIPPVGAVKTDTLSRVTVVYDF